MKVVLSIIVSLMMFSACTKVVVVKTNPNGKVPPGQAKKATGSQSAKPYAPGQQKKTGAAPNSGTPPGQAKKASPAPAKPGNAPGHSGAPGQQKKK